MAAQRKGDGSGRGSKAPGREMSKGEPERPVGVLQRAPRCFLSGVLAQDGQRWGTAWGASRRLCSAEDQAVPVCSPLTGTAGRPLPTVHPLPSPPARWPAWWFCRRLPCCNHARQPPLQHRGGEDAATIHPDCGGAGETLQLGKAPAAPAGGCIKAGKASQQRGLGWRGPAAAGCGVLSVGTGWGGLSTPQAPGSEPCLHLQPSPPSTGQRSRASGLGPLSSSEPALPGLTTDFQFFPSQMFLDQKAFLLQLSLQTAGRALRPTVHPFPALAWG